MQRTDVDQFFAPDSRAEFFGLADEDVLPDRLKECHRLFWRGISEIRRTAEFCDALEQAEAWKRSGDRDWDAFCRRAFGVSAERVDAVRRIAAPMDQKR
jgi:hypothetical protein